MAPPETGWVYLNIEDPMIAWLAYRGVLVSAGGGTLGGVNALSIWFTRRLRDAIVKGQSAAYKAESELEDVRMTKVPDAVPRLDSLFIFPDHESALKAPKRWGLQGQTPFTPEYLVELELYPTCKATKVDSQWIHDKLGTVPPADWGEKYFLGEPAGFSPVWELLFHGRAVICGTELREQAKSVALERWPGTRGMLELARLGAWLGSDLGLSVGIPVSDPEGLRITHVINMVDADNPTFLDRVHRLIQESPHLVDLDAIGEMNLQGQTMVPDLSDEQFVAPLNDYQYGP